MHFVGFGSDCRSRVPKDTPGTDSCLELEPATPSNPDIHGLVTCQYHTQ